MLMIKFYKIIENYWFRLNQKLRFVLVGGFNTLLAYVIFLFFMNVFCLNYNYAIFLQFVIGVNASIFTMNYFVFKSKNDFIKTYKKAWVFYVIMLGVNYVFMYILVEGFLLCSQISQLIYVVVFTPIMYIINEKYTYSSK